MVTDPTTLAQVARHFDGILKMGLADGTLSVVRIVGLYRPQVDIPVPAEFSHEEQNRIAKAEWFKQYPGMQGAILRIERPEYEVV